MCTGLELGIVLSAIGGITKAGGQKAEAEASADALDYNADVLRLRAKDAIARGEEDIKRLRTQVALMIGSQRAGFAGQGVRLDVGTPLDVALDTTEVSERDVITLRNNALREAWGFRTQAKLLDFQAKATKKAGSQAALGSLLGSAGNLYSIGNT